MLLRQKHSRYVRETMETRDIMFYLTEQDRITTLYWAMNSLRILRDPHFEELKPTVLKYVLSCLKEDGGFGPNPKYKSNLISTFNALQLFFILGVPFYSDSTIKFILKLQKPNGAFMNDQYGELDTRIDCCAILSLHLLHLMRKHTSIYGEFTFEQTRRLRDTPDLFASIVNFADPGDNADIDMDLENRIGYVCANGADFRRERLSDPIPQDFLDEIEFDLDQTLRHLLSCNNCDGGFGQIEGSESHAAYVFCVVSSLRSLGKLESFDKQKTIDFLVFRQLESGGFSGRVNRKEDVCYSFWAFSSLLILGFKDIDVERLTNFIVSCQGEEGGFSDRPGNQCDLYHLMFSLSSLSLLGRYDLEIVDPGFAI